MAGLLFPEKPRDDAEGSAPRGTGARFVPGDLETFLADRAAVVWDGGQPVRTDLIVSEIITRFHPQQVPPDVWRRVEAFVRDAVSAAAPGTPFIADHQMTVMAQLAIWADVVGLPLDPAVVLIPETVDRFLLEGCRHLKEGSRLNYRTNLWKIGAAVLGEGLFPPKPLPLKRSAVSAPYSEGEITDLVSWARGLPTTHMRRNVRALLAVGLGAGLPSEEIQCLLGTDIQADSRGVAVEVVRGRRRRVPIRPEWVDEVRVLAAESGERPFFVPERAGITRRDIIGFIERCSLDDKAQFNVQTLRVTWIVHHLSMGTHMLLLEQWSGVGAGQLVKYLKYATLPESEPESPAPPVRHLGLQGLGRGGVPS